MKKLFSIILALTMLVVSAACAEAVTVQPDHAVSMENYGTGDSTVKAHFDPAAAFDDQNNMTYTVLQDDLYAASDLLALKAGDKIVVAGQEDTVKSVEETGNGVDVTTDNGIDCFFYVDDTKELLGAGEDDCSPIASELGVYTFPLADQVIVRIWTVDDNGCQSEELDELTLPAAEVKGIFIDRTDSAKPDYIDFEYSNHITVRVQDGKVTEITVDWGSDD